MKLIFTLIIASCLGPVFAQDAHEYYRASDSLYKANEFKAAAIANMSGIRADKNKDNPNRYMYAAGAFAQAGLPDSAFAALQSITSSNRISPAAVRSMSANKDLKPLLIDSRWQPLLDKATKKAESNYKIEEIVYGHKEGIALTMLQVAPIGKPNGKAIIRVVAGSWYSSFSQAENYIMSSYDYLQKGFKVFHVMVGSNPRYNIPEQVADVKRSVRYIRYYAAQLGIDPEKIGIEGGSAGGHLSLTAAFADEAISNEAPDPIDRVSSRVQAVAVLYPPTDFLNWGGKGMNMVNVRPLLELNKVWGALDFRALNESNMTFVPVTDTAARNRLAMGVSPVYAVSPDDPPVFFMHGDADPTVPLQQSLILLENLKEAGVKHRFIIKGGGKHNPNDMMPEWGDAVDWFNEHLK